MCLAIPAQVIQLSADGLNATVSLNGVKVDVSLALVDDIKLNDYVLVHVGYALNKIDPDEAQRTLALFEQAGALNQPDQPT